VNITNNSVQSILGDGKVLSWAELGGQTSVENSLTSELSQDSNTECDPSKLEDVSEDVEVSCGEDEDDNRSVCETGGSWVVPGEEGGEEGVVVCEGLSSCSISSWWSTSGSKVGKFVLRAISLLLYAGSNWACRMLDVYEQDLEVLWLTIDGVLGDWVVDSILGDWMVLDGISSI
jgi:hypothetical protein